MFVLKRKIKIKIMIVSFTYNLFDENKLFYSGDGNLWVDKVPETSVELKEFQKIIEVHIFRTHQSSIENIKMIEVSDFNYTVYRNDWEFTREYND